MSHVGSQLAGRVALVTGSSKNIGRGIAEEVAAAGATTYLTARTLGASADEPGSLRETVAHIEAAGGEAIPLVCDHGDDADVERVFEEIQHRHGRLDLLVNNASPDFSSMVGRAFWELPFDDMSRCLDIGPRSAFVATSLAARLMVPRRSGVVVNVSSHGSHRYLLSVPYGAGKAGIDKVSFDTALELEAHNVAVIALWPGLVLTEGLMAMTTVGPDGRRRLNDLDVSFGESPRYTGKAVVALAADPNVMARTASAFKTTELALQYDFREDDGSQPAEFDNLWDYLGPDEVPDYWKLVERFPDRSMPNPFSRVAS
jgi:NAD(P)-dependent dehydrogenase (short-subunit alcohol dehydrogenase family)